MSKSIVYFSDLRTSPKESLPEKLLRLTDMVGLKQIVPERGLVAVKLHFGEKGNTACIRPAFVRQIVDRIRHYGGFPFLTDSNTLYVGTRSDSVSHLRTAIENGFAYSVVNAPIIIADGMRGSSSTPVRIDQRIFTNAHISKEIVESDALISLAHFTGHELSGFAGTIKNLAMGCASRQGKMAQHADLSPKVKRKRCVGCGDCISHCAHAAIHLDEDKAAIDAEKCVGCGKCIIVCPEEAIRIRWNADIPLFQKKMAEYALAVVTGKMERVAFFNFLTHVSPSCDCQTHNDAPIVQDLGIVASTDPVAVDQAAVDLVNGQKGLDTSCLTTHKEAGQDKFRALYPEVDWEVQLDYAEEIGLGGRRYDLVDIGG